MTKQDFEVIFEDYLGMDVTYPDHNFSCPYCEGKMRLKWNSSIRQQVMTCDNDTTHIKTILEFTGEYIAMLKEVIQELNEKNVTGL